MSQPEANADTATLPAGVPKPSAIGGFLKLLVPAILAAAAAYGGSRGAAAHPAPAASAQHAEEAHPPGPTVALDPFLVTIHDGNKKSHAMKVSLAIEFEATQKEELLKPFAPRLRDAILAYVRAISYEDATDGAQMDKLRKELLERCRAAGATGATHVLITDFVIQ